MVVFEAVVNSKKTARCLASGLTVAPLLWIRIYRTVIVLLQIVVYGDSRQPFFAAILIVSLAVIGWRESLRLLSSVVMLLILVSAYYCC